MEVTGKQVSWFGRCVSVMTVDPALFLDPIMTTICVDERNFVVHKALLCAKLGYFKAAYNTKMREANDDEFRLVDVDEQGFKALVAWLYTGNVCLKGGEVFDRLTCVDERMEVRPDEDFHSEGLLDDFEEDEEEMMMDYYRYVDESGGHMVWYDDQDEVENDDGEEMSLEERLGVDEITSREMWQEGMFLREIWPHYKAADLDASQWRVMLQRPEVLGPALEAKWRKSLKQKEEEEVLMQVNEEGKEEEDPAAYDALIKQYIVADRFDAAELRNQLISLLQIEHQYQLSVIGGRHLPSFESVARAFDNLPEEAKLRYWLVNLYAAAWLPTRGGIEEEEAKEILPKDFIFELMLKNSETAFWRTENGAGVTGEMDICYYHEHATPEDQQRCQEG